MTNDPEDVDPGNSSTFAHRPFQVDEKALFPDSVGEEEDEGAPPFWRPLGGGRLCGSLELLFSSKFVGSPYIRLQLA